MTSTGISIGYDDTGEGVPVVLVHGHPFDRTMWADQVRALGAESRIITPDLRGYGESTVVPARTPIFRLRDGSDGGCRRSSGKLRRVGAQSPTRSLIAPPGRGIFDDILPPTEAPMIVWIIPLCVFPTMAALYLGGNPLRLEGGGAVRQLLGLLASLALYLAVWAGARAALGGLVGVAPAVVAATLVAIVLLPFSTRAAFRVFGVRILRDGAAVH